MPREHRVFTLNAALALGLLKKLKHGESQNIFERDPEYDLFAFSDPNTVATLTCHNWLRDRYTGAKLTDLPDLFIRNVYQRVVDCGMYRQRFVVLMFSLQCVKPKEFDSKKVVWAKKQLRPFAQLGFDQAERADRMAELHDTAAEYEIQKRYALAFARPIEGKKYGKGALLERMEVSYVAGKGGILERRTNLGRLDLRGDAAGANDDHRGP